MTSSGRAFPTRQLSPREIRAAWRDWLAEARRRGEAALAGDPYDKMGEIALARGVFKVGRATCPFPDAPARGAFQAFTALAATFTATTGAERRQWMAPVLIAFSRMLEDLLDAEGVALAAESRRRIGDVD